MARTLDNVTIHTTNIADYVVKLAVTADGHFAARAGIDPTDAHDAIFAWLQTLPDLPVVAPEPIAAPAATVAPVVDEVQTVGQPIEVVATVTPDPIVKLTPVTEPDAS